MSRFYLIIPLLVIITASCSNKDIIPRDQLPQILAEMYIADRSVMNDPQKMARVDSVLVYEPVLQKYGYNTKTLINTFNYYLPTPQKLKSSFTAARKILEERMGDIRIRIAVAEKSDSIFAPIHKLIREADSLKYMDSYQRSLRWMIAPEIFPKRGIYIPDSLSNRYEHPKMLIWWQNNFKTERKKFYQYEKNSSTIPIHHRPEPNKERLSLPEH